MFKALDVGLFAKRPQLELYNQASLLFFNKDRGCDCELVVYRSAEAQISAWPAEEGRGIPVHRIDMSKRPDLVRQYKVIRAPTLILLNAEGREIWRQDTGLSDEAPLDLENAQASIQKLNSH